MKRPLIASLLLWNFILVACASSGSASTTTAAPTRDPRATSSTNASASSTVEITPTFEGCYYIWTTQDLPQTSAEVNQTIKELQGEASGRARAYGENCVYGDGHADFSILETDFYITFNVKDLKDDKALGNWIINIMTALNAFPRGVVPGGQDGFVEITFRSGDDQRILRVDIDKFKNLPKDINGSDVMKTLFPNP